MSRVERHAGSLCAPGVDICQTHGVDCRYKVKPTKEYMMELRVIAQDTIQVTHEGAKGDYVVNVTYPVPPAYRIGQEVDPRGFAQKRVEKALYDAGWDYDGAEDGAGWTPAEAHAYDPDLTIPTILA
jgi:hypothetical protein